METGAALKVGTHLILVSKLETLALTEAVIGRVTRCALINMQPGKLPFHDDFIPPFSSPFHFSFRRTRRGKFVVAMMSDCTSPMPMFSLVPEGIKTKMGVYTPDAAMTSDWGSPTRRFSLVPNDTKTELDVVYTTEKDVLVRTIKIFEQWYREDTYCRVVAGLFAST
jgi:hypothetical protein